jgi:hypothetical protein
LITSTSVKEKTSTMKKNKDSFNLPMSFPACDIDRLFDNSHSRALIIVGGFLQFYRVHFKALACQEDGVALVHN